MITLNDINTNMKLLNLEAGRGLFGRVASRNRRRAGFRHGEIVLDLISQFEPLKLPILVG